MDGDVYEWMVGVTVGVPLGNLADRSRYERSRLNKERAIMELKNLEDRIDLEIKVALDNIESSRDRIEVAERFVILAKKTLRQEEERMKKGLSDTFRIIIFQNALVDAKTRKVSALVDYQKALAGLYQAMGTNLQRHDMALNFSDVKKSVQ
ncbi:MAG: TolC family protein [Deltaproteobacteria bacterium]|nr:TolC family protein [Deltaproteobacteria bacterium]